MGGGVIELIDEILSHAPNASGLAINWQCFGSNGQETADYSRGVLERFTRRAPSDLESDIGGSLYKKTIDNPRLVRYRINPHYAWYFPGKAAVNSNAEYIPPWYGNKPILADKIVINHYIIKSKEEYEKKKLPRGSCCMNVDDMNNSFHMLDRNEVFDDGILRYRAVCEKNFSSESREERIRRVEKALVHTLTQYAPSSAPPEFFVDKLETFLTCRAVAEKLGTKIGEYSAEGIALALIYRTLMEPLTYAEAQQFMKALPEILSRPFVPFCRELKDFAQNNLLPVLCESLKNGNVMEGTPDWMARADWLYIQKLLRLIK